MTAVVSDLGNDLLAEWLESTQPRRRAEPRAEVVAGGARFAFYGRVSTTRFQDRASSTGWQRDFAQALIRGHGRIVAEYFDTGCTRRRPWEHRPRANALLAALADPDRGFDAVVVGEYERAFCGDQLARLAPVLQRYGVSLWLPEAGGPVDFDDPAHQALVTLLGAQSRREVLRAHWRVTAAMQAQAREQGRCLGGRPPYGYQLVDAGPHPNRTHAGWGRRLHRLVPNPATAPQVQWMFAQRLAGRSLASIVRSLNDNAVQCPSGADPGRNRHRSGTAWTVQSVASILSNPRYTGRQVWNRQHTDRDPHDRPDTAQWRRWNPTAHWVVSKNASHPALVSERDFIAAQAVNATPTPQDGTTRQYLLVGLVHCGVCGRRMESCWVHGRPGYRCRHGHTSSTPPRQPRLKNLYWRQDHILAHIASDLEHHDLLDATAECPAISCPDELAEHVRAKRMMITCNANTCGLTSTAN